MDGRPQKQTPAEAARLASERLYQQLLPWFGVAGCDALFRRALAEAQAVRPALAKVRLRAGSDGLFAGIDEAVAKNGADGVATGLHEMHANLLELLSRMIVGALTATGVTVLMTTEATGGYANVQLSTENISFITDDIVVQQFAEIDGALEKVLVILKMRGSQHSTQFHRYTIDANGATIGEPLDDFRGIGTGHPERKPRKGAR